MRATEGETRLWIGVALAGAIALQVVLPARFVLHPAYIAPAVQAVLVIVLGMAHPDRFTHRSQRLRVMSQILLGLVAATNAISLGMLIHVIVTGSHIKAVELLLGGGEIWVTNVIVFGLWFWEYDRGGPAARASGHNDEPDLLFPQMTDEHLARNWEPIFLDYLFVSFTNSTAFSPTDTMPLSRWSKVLFAVQAAVSLITVALVAARAVNILPGS